MKSHTLKVAPFKSATDIAGISPADTAILLRKAHRVLLHCVPGASLPDDLARVRDLLDAHMFGRDKRVSRDDVVEVARQIDGALPRSAA